jgi:hypothetical protein
VNSEPESSIHSVRNALAQIAEIRGALRTAQIFRGYRPRSIAMTGLGAIVAGSYVTATNEQPVVSWLLIAVASFSLVFAEMCYDYSLSLSSVQQKLARQVLNQFLPPIGLGAGLSLLSLQNGFEPSFLPGLWATLYGLSLFSARPYLPHGVGWVGAFFCGSGLLLWSPAGAALNFKAMPLVFGFGQIFLALMLHWNRSRSND